MELSLADRIRQFAYDSYIVPARQRGEKSVTLRAGDVHTRMNLTSRMPAVCGAIGTRLFETQYHLRLIDRRGPTQGAEVTFKFELL